MRNAYFLGKGARDGFAYFFFGRNDLMAKRQQNDQPNSLKANNFADSESESDEDEQQQKNAMASRALVRIFATKKIGRSCGQSLWSCNTQHRHLH